MTINEKQKLNGIFYLFAVYFRVVTINHIPNYNSNFAPHSHMLKAIQYIYHYTYSKVLDQFWINEKFSWQNEKNDADSCVLVCLPVY